LVRDFVELCRPSQVQLYFIFLNSHYIFFLEMCVLFALWIRNPKFDGYRLILASNRDEIFQRRTSPAASWSDAPHVFGGNSNVISLSFFLFFYSLPLSAERLDFFLRHW